MKTIKEEYLKSISEAVIKEIEEEDLIACENKLKKLFKTYFFKPEKMSKANLLKELSASNIKKAMKMRFYSIEQLESYLKFDESQYYNELVVMMELNGYEFAPDEIETVEEEENERLLESLWNKIITKLNSK